MSKINPENIIKHFEQTKINNYSTSLMEQASFIKPSARMRAARVTVVVPCVFVCVRSNLPPHTLESQKRDTNGFIEIQEPF